MLYYYFPSDCNGQSDKSRICSVDLTPEKIELFPASMAKEHPERCCKLWRSYILYETIDEIRRAQRYDD